MSGPATRQSANTARFEAPAAEETQEATARSRKPRFTFSVDQDILLIREAIKDFPYGANHGDRLKMWDAMASRLQQADRTMTIDGRRCRERCELLVQGFRNGRVSTNRPTSTPAKDAELYRFLGVLAQMISNAERARDEKRAAKRGRVDEDSQGEDSGPAQQPPSDAPTLREDGSDSEDVRREYVDGFDPGRVRMRASMDRMELLHSKIDQLARLMREDAERRERQIALEREKLEVERRRMEAAADVRRRLTEAVVMAVSALTSNMNGL